MKTLKILSSLTAIFIVSACAQSEPVVVEPIKVEPTYDKWGHGGGGGCVGGSTAGAASNCIPRGDDGYPRTPGTTDGGDGSGDGGSGSGSATGA